MSGPPKIVYEDLKMHSNLSNLVIVKQLLNYSVLIRLKKLLTLKRAKIRPILLRASSVAVIKGKTFFEF